MPYLHVSGECRYCDEPHDYLPSNRTKSFSYRTGLPTLAEYVIVHQAQARVEHYQQQATGQWLMTTFDGLAAMVALPALGCALLLQDVYEGIAFPAGTDDAE